MVLWSAFFLGLAGSLHCVGMCGPLALAVPQSGNNKHVAGLAYVFGKSISYAFLGAIAGVIGASFRMVGFQALLSIGTGVLLFLFFFSSRLSLLVEKTALNKFNTIVKVRLSHYYKQRGFSTSFLIGIFNGFLPCGMLAIALIAALSTGYVELAALYMFLFGLSNGIVLFILRAISQLSFRHFSIFQRKIIPYYTLLMGVWLILRGVVYTIPDQDNKTFKVLQNITMCHTSTH